MCEGERPGRQREGMVTKLQECLEIIGGLSKPSKMPWYSWSTPATACVTGSKLAKKKGTVCSKCYALKGMYLFPNTQTAMERRLKARDDPRFVAAFVYVLNTKYNNIKGRENRFRWYDSGDIGTLKHLKDISIIAKYTPQIRHWLPTKEVGIVKEYYKSTAPSWKDDPLNLIIRPSHPMIGGKWPDNRLQSTSGRDNDDTLYQCPAFKQDHMCKNCDACWTNQSINYRMH